MAMTIAITRKSAFEYENQIFLFPFLFLSLSLLLHDSRKHSKERNKCRIVMLSTMWWISNIEFVPLFLCPSPSTVTSVRGKVETNCELMLKQWSTIRTGTAAHTLIRSNFCQIGDDVDVSHRCFPNILRFDGEWREYGAIRRWVSGTAVASTWELRTFHF